MQDYLDPPAPSIVKPVLYGLVLGAAAMAIFVAAYVIAPNFGLVGTFLIAALIAVGVVMALNAVPNRATEDMAALVRGEEVAPFAVEAIDQPAAPSPVELQIAEREAHAAALRKQTDEIDRSTRGGEWLERVRDLADELKELATLELSVTSAKVRRSGLAHLRQAASLYQRVVTSRGQARSSQAWGTAQLALGECLLILGEAEGARDGVMEAVNAFTAGLEVAELEDDQRAAGQNGLARAEGVLASMSESMRYQSNNDDLL